MPYHNYKLQFIWIKIVRDDYQVSKLKYPLTIQLSEVDLLRFMDEDVLHVIQKTDLLLNKN